MFAQALTHSPSLAPQNIDKYTALKRYAVTDFFVGESTYLFLAERRTAVSARGSSHPGPNTKGELRGSIGTASESRGPALREQRVRGRKTQVP